MCEADCFAQPRPALNFGQWGVPPGPPIAGSATVPLPCPSLFPPLRNRLLTYSEGVWGSAVTCLIGGWGGAQAEIQFGAFSLKIRHLVAPILLIFLQINSPHSVFIFYRVFVFLFSVNFFLVSDTLTWIFGVSAHPWHPQWLRHWHLLI